MGKILFLLLLVALVYALWRANVAARARRDAAPPKARAIQPIVRCSHCDLHLPLADALARGEHHVWSPEHERAFAARGERR